MQKIYGNGQLKRFNYEQVHLSATFNYNNSLVLFVTQYVIASRGFLESKKRLFGVAYIFMSAAERERRQGLDGSPDSIRVHGFSPETVYILIVRLSVFLPSIEVR